MDKYRIYCETDENYEEVIASAEPTTCPVNAAHDVRADSVCMVESNVEVNDGTITDLSLNDYKQLRRNEIDKRTEELIADGFMYNNKVFSLENDAQHNLLGSDLARDDVNFSFPVTYATKDNQDSETLNNAGDIHSFFLQALGTKRAHLDSGNDLINQINAAVDEAAVDAIVDNR